MEVTENKTISQLLRGILPRLRVNEEECLQYERVNPFEPSIPLVDKTTYVGIECEVENIRKHVPLEDVPFWRAKEDGSLRNRGVEFVSIPLRISRVEHALSVLFNRMKATNVPDYSHRTSTHVHVNIRTLTVENVTNMVLAYMVVERALFHWVGHNRDNNIFCVPLHKVVITNRITERLSDIKSFGWSKYTALNLAPILDRGTIEFRHLHGTNDMTTIMTWINLIVSLKKYALRVPLETTIKRVFSMNTVSDYRQFLYDIFADLAPNLFYPEVERDMSACVSNLKAQAFWDTAKPRSFKKALSIAGIKTNKEILRELEQRRVARNPVVDEVDDPLQGLVMERVAGARRIFIQPTPDWMGLGTGEN